MARVLPALLVSVLAATACLGSESQPAGKVSVVVTLGRIGHPTTHRYTLNCGPAGGTVPGPDVACGALADYLRRRNDLARVCIGFTPRMPRTVLTGRFAGHRLRLQITPGSWCGVSDALMRDYWILSTFPCSTLVFRYANQHPYSKGIAPPRCLRETA
jgi:hypothetical protein